MTDLPMDNSDILFNLKEDLRHALEKMKLWPSLSSIYIDLGPNNSFVIFVLDTVAIARIYCAEVERIEHLPDEGCRTNACRCFMEDGFRVYPCDNDGKIDTEDGAQLCMDVLDSRTALSACLGMLVNYAYDKVVPE